MFNTELFVQKLAASVVFYRCLLGKGCAEHNEKRALFKADGGGSLLLTDETVLNDDHYFAAMAESKKGKGVELILPVVDVEMVYNKFNSLYPNHIESEIRARPWGKLDFRVVDPDGYYVRVTS
ncbi:VOC family protein [Terribacillus sp. 179-K 1B1 HS]|uniref:VOC family protein n=1 Tax=Terribacillus sp. 179-K 1B1 HS TaxID=3142388 RepID=UPI0039A3652A